MVRAGVADGLGPDWLWCLVLAAVAVVQLLVVRDSRAPLMLADAHGVRVRRGETWTGLQWQDIAHVEVQSPASWLRDGKIVVHPREQDDTAEPPVSPETFTVPLAATTRLEYDGLTGDLVADLDAAGQWPRPRCWSDPDRARRGTEDPRTPRHRRRRTRDTTTRGGRASQESQRSRNRHPPWSTPGSSSSS